MFGKASGFAANLDLSSLDGSNGFRLSGAATGDFSGGSVASAGDVNGDGFADLIVGAHGADPTARDPARATWCSARPRALPPTSTCRASTAATASGSSGAAAIDNSGRSVASAGDVNGDGFADLIVGADGADPNGNTSGASYVVFGKASGFAANLDLSSLDGSNGFQLNGAAADRPQRLVGRRGRRRQRRRLRRPDRRRRRRRPDGGHIPARATWCSARPRASRANLDLSQPRRQQRLPAQRRRRRTTAAASSVASAGDVNGDGFADLIVGASAPTRTAHCRRELCGVRQGLGLRRRRSTCRA